MFIAGLSGSDLNFAFDNGIYSSSIEYITESAYAKFAEHSEPLGEHRPAATARHEARDAVNGARRRLDDALADVPVDRGVVHEQYRGVLLRHDRGVDPRVQVLAQAEDVASHIPAVLIRADFAPAD